MNTADEYLSLIGDWVDPNPPLVVSEHEGFQVVRDDLLGVGSKVRALDYLVGHAPEYASIKEWVFGSCPAHGYAQISMPSVTGRYNKDTVMFMAQRAADKLTVEQHKGIECGTRYHWVPNGMLNVTQARAREYVAESPDTRAVLPLGLEHPTVIASFIKIARTIPTPKEFWTVGSSGTLNRALQLAWPEADAHVVSVGHTMSPREIGRAKMWRSSYKFDRPIKPKDAPPFPSAPKYDAKGWEFIRAHGKPGAYYWNVAA